MKTVTHYPGAGIDIVYTPDGQLVVATVVGAKVRLERGPVVIETSAAPKALLARELRVAVASDGRVACISQIINPDRAVVYVNGFWRVLADYVRGQRCVAIWAVGDQFRWATIIDGGDTIRIEEEGGGVSTHPVPGGTSQGIVAVEEGRPVLADTRQGNILWHAFHVGPWTLGEATNPDRVELWGAGNYSHTVVTGNTSQPRLAVSGETVAVGYSLDGQPTVVTLTPPYPIEQAGAEIVAIGRPMRLAFFEFTPATLPSNAALVQVSTWEWSLMQAGRKVGTYVSGEPDGDLAAIERSIAKVSGRGVPVYAYWPRALQGGRLPRGCDVTVVEGYQRKGESLAGFETGLRAAVRRCGRAAIACACYTSNATLTTDLAALVPVYARVAKDMPNVEDLLVFSGSGRPTGYQDHPEVHSLWRELFAGIPSAPPLPPKPPTPKPPPAPTPPVERPAPMFPTDDELTDFTNRLEAKYRDELHRAPVATAVDPLGRGRWTYDYALHRQAGQSHDAAWDKVNFTINEIAGIPNP